MSSSETGPSPPSSLLSLFSFLAQRDVQADDAGTVPSLNRHAEGGATPAQQQVTQLEAELGCTQLSSFRIAIPISCLPLRLQYLLVRTELLAPLPQQPSLGNDIYVNHVAPYLEEKMETAWLTAVVRGNFRSRTSTS
jgi:hypothetical protein